MAVKQDIDVGLLAFIGIVGAMLLLIVVLGVQAWYSFERDRLTQIRYASDRNVDWIRLREEQYGNIADDVGNQTVYAAADPDRPRPPAFRFPDEGRRTAAIPIHEAMALVVREHSGQEVDADTLRDLDRRPVRATARTFSDPAGLSVQAPADRAEPGDVQNP